MTVGDLTFCDPSTKNNPMSYCVGLLLSMEKVHSSEDADHRTSNSMNRRCQKKKKRRCQKTPEAWTVFMEGRVTERGKGSSTRDMKGPRSSKRHTADRAADRGPEPPVKDTLEKY